VAVGDRSHCVFWYGHGRERTWEKNYLNSVDQYCLWV